VTERGSNASQPRRRPMRVDARRNRERLLRAAIQVVIEHGVDAPLDEVARRAGVGIATLYRRFPDRSALLRAMALDVLARVAQEARAALAEQADPFQTLGRCLHRALDLQIAAVMPVLDVQLDLAQDDQLQQAREELADLFSTIVGRAHDNGSLRADVGLGDIGLMVIRLARPLPGSFTREFDDAAAHRQLDILLDGLRAGGSAGRVAPEDRSRRWTDVRGQP
jgi:AcrR family transcriptional regulator